MVMSIEDKAYKSQEAIVDILFSDSIKMSKDEKNVLEDVNGYIDKLIHADNKKDQRKILDELHSYVKGHQKLMKSDEVSSVIKDIFEYSKREDVIWQSAKSSSGLVRQQLLGSHKNMTNEERAKRSQPSTPVGTPRSADERDTKRQRADSQLKPGTKEFDLALVTARANKNTGDETARDEKVMRMHEDYKNQQEAKSSPGKLRKGR